MLRETGTHTRQTERERVWQSGAKGEGGGVGSARERERERGKEGQRDEFRGTDET